MSPSKQTLQQYLNAFTRSDHAEICLAWRMMLSGWFPPGCKDKARDFIFDGNQGVESERLIFHSGGTPSATQLGCNRE